MGAGLLFFILFNGKGGGVCCVFVYSRCWGCHVKCFMESVTAMSCLPVLWADHVGAMQFLRKFVLNGFVVK